MKPEPSAAANVFEGGQTNSARQENRGPQPSARRTAALTLGALGVVFGDIGTSPLYAMRKSIQAAGGRAPDAIAAL
ncbi:MAG TPA: KUP/HAK/KT family potassium transporter, partial [Rhizomicrobium sp.]